VIAAGIGIWLLRARLKGLIDGLKSIQWAAENSFGFEAVNGAISRSTNSLADALRKTQTGHLGWNVLGIVAAVVILFVFIAAGA
jgi:hypothetical protein